MDEGEYLQDLDELRKAHSAAAIERERGDVRERAGEERGGVQVEGELGQSEGMNTREYERSGGPTRDRGKSLAQPGEAFSCI